MKDISLAAKQLLAAATLLEEHGWRQGRYYTWDTVTDVFGGPYCIVGALHVASGADFRSSPMAMISAKLAPELRSGHFLGGLVHFNDKPGRTKEQVIARLRELAATM